MADGAIGGRITRANADPRLDLAAFRDELARARRQVAILEDQYRDAVARDRQARSAAPPLVENPRLARACNAALWAVVAMPFALAAMLMLGRLFG